MKKTVLIVYSQLYDTSALALKNYFESDGRYDVIAIDEKTYYNFHFIKTYHGLYKVTYRHLPSLNNVIINLPTAEVSRKKDSDGNIAPYKPNSEAFQRWRKFDNIMMRFDADYVICTSQYAIHKAVIAREKYNLKGKIFALATDYALQGNFVSHDVDGYFVVTGKCKKLLVDKGIDEDKIYVVAMPLNEAMQIKRSKEDVRKQFNIRNDLPIVTVVGGRYGSKYICKTLECICENKDFNFIFVVNGNGSPQKKLTKLAKNASLNLTNNIYFVQSGNELERAYYISDYVISAPTAAITYEVLLRKIPLLLMDSANNVETKNSKFLISGGYAYSAINKTRLTRALESVKEDDEDWRDHCDRKFKWNGCEQVLMCIDAIDRGEDPHDALLAKNIPEADEVGVQIESAAPAAEKQEKKKRRRWFK